MNASSPPSNQTSYVDQSASQLAGMRRIATGILIGLLAVYIGTFFIEETLAILFVRSAAGAGVVGALADWFAVVALFRRPLGLPIPHTALLPNNQERVAHSISNFVSDHFLDPKAISAAIHENRITAKVSGWAARENVTGPFVDRIIGSLQQLRVSDFGSILRPEFVKLARRAAQKSVQSESLALEVSRLLTKGVRGEGLTKALEYVSDSIEDHGDVIEHLVSENSRWWVHIRVDKTTARMLAVAIKSVLRELSKEDTKLRRSLESTLEDAIQEMTESGTLSVAINDAAGNYFGGDEFEGLVDKLLDALLNSWAVDDDDNIHDALKTMIDKVVSRVADDRQVQDDLDRMIAGFVNQAITHLRPFISKFIVDTIMAWDTDDLVDRIESQAGKDLQFIRINGSILGALIGGALFAVERALAG